MDIVKVLTELNTSFGPSGCEAPVREKIAELARPFADEIYTDVMGNLIAVKKSGKKNAPRLMFAAHMDSIGLIVTYIEESGLLRFGAVGGVNARNILATPVRFENGAVGTIGMDEDAKAPEIDKMFIDIGAASRKDAEKYVKCGDMAVYDTPVRALGDGSVVSPYLDNRAGCAAQLLAMEALKKPVFDCYFVFTVQEEVGLRGAKPATYGIAPQYAIVCDGTLTDDIPWTSHIGTSKIGLGASIKVMDKSVICHPEMVEALRAVAAKKKIKAQTDVLKQGGTDGSEMRKSASGVYTGGVSVPMRYVHTPQELSRVSDIEDCGKLMAAFAATRPEF